LRIVPAAALVVVAAAGCGGGGRPQEVAVHGVPAALAQKWEGQASAIAVAASAGDSCRALRLANALQSDVRAQQHRLPLRLRSPLLTGVSALADRITCTPPPKPPGHKPDHHDKHGHGHHGHGDGGGKDK
jgi:hypothetical protein